MLNDIVIPEQLQREIDNACKSISTIADGNSSPSFLKYMCRTWMQSSLARTVDIYKDLIKQEIHYKINDCDDEILEHLKKTGEGLITCRYGDFTEQTWYVKSEYDKESFEQFKNFLIDKFANELAWKAVEENQKYITGMGAYEIGEESNDGTRDD